MAMQLWLCMYDYVCMYVCMHACMYVCLHFFFFLVGYVEERLWWPMKGTNIGGKKKASS